MANDRDESRKPDPDENEDLQDLDIDAEEAANVKGGRRGLSADPCEGGE
jgi:hypothetical protein